MKTEKILTIIVMFFVFASIVFAAPITGTVIDTATNNGIANANVSIFTTAGLLLNSTVTDENGTYSVDSVNTGVLILNASATGYNTQSIPKYIGGGGDTVNFGLGPISAYVISGTATPNSAGINIKLKQGSSTIYETVTTTGGSYSISVLPGNYTFEATFPNYNVYTATVSITGMTVHNFVMTPAITTGAVNGYVRNANGTALIGANVRLRFNGGTIAETNTDGTGWYSLTNITPNNYNITASHTGYNDQTYQISISANSTITRDFNLSGAATTCSQSVSYGSWSSCSNNLRSRTVTYTNYQNVCGWTYVTTQTERCSSGSSSTSGGSGTQIPSLTSGPVTSKIKYPDFIEQNPIKYTLGRFDSVVFYYGDVKYALQIIDIQKDSATFKWYPTYETVTLEEGELNQFKLSNSSDNLKLTLLDTYYVSNNTAASTATVNLFLDRKIEKAERSEETETQNIVERMKDAIVKVKGETVPKNVTTSVAVGASVSATTVILGLLIFFIARKIFG